MKSLSILFFVLILLLVFTSVVFYRFTAQEEGKTCGGIRGEICPFGYSCELDGDYPDASGICVNVVQKFLPPLGLCPKDGYINCLPGPGPRDPRCGQWYLDWAAKNCPVFKGPLW